MKDLKKEYDEVVEVRRKIIGKIRQLSENEAVKEYLELKRENERLSSKQLDLYKQMKEKEYSSCQHILVYSEVNYDRYEGRVHKKCGCIKCGLDNRVLSHENSLLFFDEKIMYDFFRKNKFTFTGIETKNTCDLELGQAIYSKIKEVHKDIDDETAVKYFEIALDNIRNIEVNDERKVSRAKRLALTPDFKKWNSSDVHND